MQDHEHNDAGHSHSSPPHSHSYLDRSYWDHGSYIPQLVSGKYGYQDTSRGTVAASVAIENAESNIGGVSSSYRSGSETRPRNMKVIWVMKCW